MSDVDPELTFEVVTIPYDLEDPDQRDEFYRGLRVVAAAATQGYYDPSEPQPVINTDRLVSTPDAIKDTVRATFDSDELIDDEEIDELLLGVGIEETEDVLFAPLGKVSKETGQILGVADINKDFDGENTWAKGGDVIWTEYDLIRSILRHASMRPEEMLYDLGSGYGRLPLYAGIVTGLECRGVELVPGRAELTQRRADLLELPNVQFREANVKDVDYSDGDVFYMYAPFTEDTLSEVIMRLREISEVKPIRIIARGRQDSFRGRGWLKEQKYIHSVERPGLSRRDYHFSIFESDR